MKYVNISIVGRPNVGKSTLFNTLIKRRLAIEDAVAGTTRDRVSYTLVKNDYLVELVDTGGMETLESTGDIIWTSVQKQISTALKQADIILFVLDIRSGLTGLDKEIAQLLHKQNKPVLVIANKADTQRFDSGINDFYRLGFDDIIAVSALQRRNIDEVWVKTINLIAGLGIKPQEPAETASDQTIIRIAIAGKRNVGKSTLVNTLANEERVIVSEIPGTTRDSIDVRFEYEGKTYVAIDTAGLRKKGKAKESVEFFSRQRTEDAVKRADVVLFLIDAVEKVSDVDKKVAGFILEQHKPSVLVINKWDLACSEHSESIRQAKPDDSALTEQYLKYLNKTLPFFSFMPLVFISAQTGFNVNNLLPLCDELYQQAGAKVQTALLNKAIENIRRRLPSSGRTTRHPRIYYATQTGIYPPTINISVNDTALFSDLTMRHVDKFLRQTMPFTEVPIRFILKGKQTRKRE
ncbi:MAG: ribosome biogenesis GTPase Der [Planctomycetes bacterium]|nr:ribosome biogenesis GTPase Der [Planctomycetota bacterium]